jgi:hypothetical protein
MKLLPFPLPEPVRQVRARYIQKKLEKHPLEELIEDLD